LASDATSGLVKRGLASCTASTIIFSKQIAINDIRLTACENLGFSGCQTIGTGAVKSKRRRRTFKSVMSSFLVWSCDGQDIDHTYYDIVWSGTRSTPYRASAQSLEIAKGFVGKNGTGNCAARVSGSCQALLRGDAVVRRLREPCVAGAGRRGIAFRPLLV